MNNTYDQIIIGAGFAGIGMGIQLKRKGWNNFVILERDAHLGGTWWDNHYPGAACDVESHLYSFSFEPNPDWSRNFSPQEEILHYLERCAEKYKLKEHFHFNSNVTKAAFDANSGIWTVSTTDGKIYSAKSLISCSGGLSQPAFPDIKGLKTFKGKMFHTAQWQKDIDLKNKTVAVIGTGASAIQVVPAIAPEVKQLNLFQRTPPWIIPKPDKEISPFRKFLYKNVPFARQLYRTRLYWMHEVMAIGFTKNVNLLKWFSKLSLSYLNRKVKDETLRKKLTPNYVMGCKRILLSNNYYPALLRENVEVITDHIAEINETGILTTDGKQYNSDVIILATGFQAAESAAAYDIKGKNGYNLNEVWSEGPEAYFGTTVSGFPNFFLIVGPNTGLGHSSMILMIEAQINYIMEAIRTMKKKGVKYLNIKKNVQQEFNNDIQAKLTKTVWQTGGCHSWYQNKNGKNVTLWPGFTFTFMNRMKRFEVEKYEMVR